MIAKRLAFWFRENSLAGWTLLVVALVELFVCIGYYEQRWDNVMAAQLLPPANAREGLVIQWNGLGYYAWLRSLLIDGDWDFDNEFDEHNPHRNYVPPPQYRTPLGRRANQWSIGPACIWAVAVVPGHFLWKALGGSLGPWAADGYSLPYQLLVGATSLLVAFAGLGIVYGICRTQARPGRAALAAALLTVGTTIVYYNAIELSLPHGLGAAVLAGLVWYWLKTYGSMRPGRWFLVGLLVGAAALMRWQLATFAVLPAAEALLTGWHAHGFAWAWEGRMPTQSRGHATRRLKVAALVAFAAAGAVLAFLPQMIAWRCVYGAWIANPIQGVSYHWLTPSLWTILCSQDRSLFYWTPLTLLACVGAFACLWRAVGSGPIDRGQPMTASMRSLPTQPWYDAREPLIILALAFVIQVYALAGMWGKGELLETTGNFAGIFLARSFGFRDLTEALVVLAPGLAWLLEQAPPWRFRLLAGLGLLLVAWNLLLVNLYTSGMIPAMGGASPATLLTQAAELVRNDPFALLQALEGPVLIGVLVAFAERKEHA